MSSAGVEVRNKMRSCGGLIESLLLVVENVIGKNDIDCKVSVVVVVVVDPGNL